MKKRKGASGSVIHCDLDCFIFGLSVWLNLRISGICFNEWYRYSLDWRPQLPGLKIPLACLLICSLCWRGKKRGIQAWENILSPYIFCEGQSIELSHPWTKYSTRQRLNATWTGAIQEGYGLLGMERNGYVDFALPDKMFTEVSVNSRQIGSQELHIIFAQGCFNLVQKQFILIKQSFTPDNKMMSDMFTTTSWNHGILLFWCLNYVLFFHRPTDPS